MKSTILLSAPYFSGRENEYVRDCMASEWVSSSGTYVSRFEEAVAEEVRATGAVATVNGTAALHLCLLMAGVQPGDEVIVPTITFIAPVNAVKYVGAVPVFMDCDSCLNMDVEKLSSFIREECRLRGGGALLNRRTGRRVAAILPVHVFGGMCDMNAVMEVARHNNLCVIEDASEALGAYMTEGVYAGRSAGTIGDYGCYSFNGNKIITCGGGGMIVAQDAAQLERARYLSTQAKDDPVHYIHNEVGYNYRLTALQAALGLGQIEQLGAIIGIKRARYRQYRKRLDQVLGLRMLPTPPYCESNYWHYALAVDPSLYGADREELMRRCTAERIQVRPLWAAINTQVPYRDCQSYRIEQAQSLGDCILNIPCSAGLTEVEFDRVCAALIGSA